MYVILSIIYIKINKQRMNNMEIGRVRRETLTQEIKMSGIKDFSKV